MGQSKKKNVSFLIGHRVYTLANSCMCTTIALMDIKCPFTEYGHFLQVENAPSISMILQRRAMTVSASFSGKLQFRSMLIQMKRHSQYMVSCMR